jgi:hypothetical protein
VQKNAYTVGIYLCAACKLNPMNEIIHDMVLETTLMEVRGEKPLKQSQHVHLCYAVNYKNIASKGTETTLMPICKVGYKLNNIGCYQFHHFQYIMFIKVIKNKKN